MIIILLFLTALVTVLLGVYLWRRSSSRDVFVFGLFSISVAFWSACVGFEALASSIESKLFFSKLQYFAVAPLPVLWLIFALSYSGQPGWMTWRRALPLLLIPALTLIIVWTNALHGLLYRNVELVATPVGTNLLTERGFWFWAVHTPYSYSLLLIGVGVLAYNFISASELYRQQYGSLLLASSFPIIANLIFLGGAEPFGGVDPTPLSFALSCLVIAPALLRYRLFDLMPVAQREVFKSLPVGIVVLDLSTRIIDINPEGLRLLETEAAIGRKIETLIPAWPTLVQNFSAAEQRTRELSVEVGDNHLELDVTLSELKGAQGQVAGYVLMARDISHQKAYERMALHDPLTGLPNRRYLELEAESALLLAKREGWQVALLYLDLDKFKPVNDVYGHDVGDVLLQRVAHRLSALSRSADFLARFGGDEFVMIAQNIDEQEAAVLGARMVSALKEPFSLEVGEVRIGGSIGVAFYPADAVSLDLLINYADTAMYAAKLSGMGVRLYDADEPL